MALTQERSPNQDNPRIPPGKTMAGKVLWLRPPPQRPQATLILASGYNDRTGNLIRNPLWQNFARGHRLALGEAWPALRFPFCRLGTRPRPARPARPAACPCGLSREGEGAPSPGRPRRPRVLAQAGRHGNRPTSVAGRRVTHSAVASAGMRSAGPRVRSPRPEQLTRQAAPGAGPQRQGGAHGPQPRPGTPASAPSHRPRPRASARRAGAAGGIVRTAQAWPRTGPEAPSPPGPGDRGSGAARARHGWARGGIRQQLRPVCLRDACSVLRPGSESSAAR